MMLCKLVTVMGKASSVNINARRLLKVVAQPTLSVTITEIRKFLRERNIEFKTGYTCLVAKCPVCCPGQGQSSKDQKPMYVNMTTGSFVCYCNVFKGSWHNLQDVLSVSSRKGFKANIPLNNEQQAEVTEIQDAKELWKSTLPVENCDNVVVENLKKTFNIQNLSNDVLKKYKVRIKENQLLVFPWYHHGNKLQGLKVLTIEKDQNGKNTFVDRSVPKLYYSGLFGWHLIGKDVTYVVLTSSEADAMAVSQSTRVPALALPRGISVLPQEVLPLLEQFEKILLWFGNDIRSWEASKQFAKKLNPKRCFFIRPKDGHPSPLEALNQGLNLSSIMKQAQPVSHKSIVSFRSLREEVFGELSHAEQVAGIKWKRYPLLNKLLKGHRRGELTVFTGPTGSGKTTFISEYSVDLCTQGVNTLWGSFEIPTIRLAKVMLTQFAKMNLEKQLDQFDQWADKFESLPLYFMTFHGQQSMKTVLDAMSHAVYVHDIEHVIIDNLQFMVGLSDRASSMDRFSQYDNVIAAFRRFVTTNNCHVTVVIHPRKEKDQEELQTASIFGTAKAAQEADNIIILQDKRLTSARGKKYIQVAKNRFDGDLGIMPLYFNKETLCMSSYPVKTSKQKVIKDIDLKGEDIQSSKKKPDGKENKPNLNILDDDDDDDDSDDDE
ncbi:twinkle mtDNA helicase-like [Ptychodera flava]|uniref:twinkle mtDNA helicase-like n=1 Tax=Ptychodera flava TaxID=63121 RepID=UPI00396A7B12